MGGGGGGAVKKKKASHHHYRPILTDLLLPSPMSNSPSSPPARMYPSMRPSPARWLVLRVPPVERPEPETRTRRDAEGGSEGEAGLSDCEMCRPSEIQLLSSAPLLAASYSLSFCFSISPSRSTHSWLLLHGNHLLVSLSCSAASVIHNICPPPHTTPLSPQQHQDRCGSTGKQSHPSYSFPACSPFLKKKKPRPKCDRNTTARPL